MFLPEVQIKEEALEEASEEKETFEKHFEANDGPMNNYQGAITHPIQSRGGVYASSFSCNSCDEKFTTKYDLNSHIGKHTFAL